MSVDDWLVFSQMTSAEKLFLFYNNNSVKKVNPECPIVELFRYNNIVVRFHAHRQIVYTHLSLVNLHLILHTFFVVLNLEKCLN